MKNLIKFLFLGLVLVIFLIYNIVPAKEASSLDELSEKFRKALLPLPKEINPKGIGGIKERSVILNLRFKLNSYNLTPEAILYLDALGRAISTDPNLRSYVYRVEGHTCSLGSAEYNKKLSIKRAEAVVQYLVNHFPLQREQFEIVGYGEERPIAPNDTEEGRQKNRRVVVVNTLKKFIPSEFIGKDLLNVKVKYVRNNQINELKNNDILTEKDYYAIEFIPKERVYVYIFQVSKKSIMPLFPNEKFSKDLNPVTPGRLYRVPSPGKWFYLDQNKGTEEFIVLAYINELENPINICKKLLSSKVISKGVESKPIVIRPEEMHQNFETSETLTPSNMFIWRLVFIHK